MTNYREIAWQGLWKNNPGLVQRLGLCPLLAVTTTLTNALGLGIATMLVLIGSNVLISLVRDYVPKEIRIPVFVMIIAALVTAVQLLVNAYAYGLYMSLGIFLPLIVTNCIIIGRAEAFASRNNAFSSAFDGLMMGLGFTLVLVLLGATREILGQGTLFDGADQLLGPWAKALTFQVWQVDTSFLLAMLPPGAFIVMGLLIALKNVIDKKLRERQPETAVQPSVARARITKVS
ncbi:electron transport complex subunit E [Shewanella oneidensis MR-1]|uniref:Ion-translocating oxidoreductase complex subunit E n=1 Tax=Shewanella oneidensis (strain ATCC 700550 / JCM 31522 / CIP 106686 / LMG 19005 / NCIMB 14063 / MR-1) TaxID=211586 RepID=RNFE_SHEON|nr:electron transport complex subunit E [Shewanella oneidensis]Q8EE76.1 RecName: Full=Ion-translocating oxidoreductase complex subunit E; AltName: Full=Rnf electron transport complex subunit E [Shewanella oneidensis MR-1]AAN55544.1 ion (H+ or Na+)-translocating NADH:ferredoxin oxidoreductase subunit RnfE [Shewanella oneidensis MR-1]MDX5995805.1 electron transport complex subunit E [Shewanella oneidensis]MEE2029477.1 Ion-translocating oxidoreductase complex subunit E [Shewanella oneidensis]QKG9